MELGRQILIAGLIIPLLFLPVRASADDGWLLDPLAGWNTAGKEIPDAALQEQASVGPMCAPLVRPPETAEDEAIVRKGWRLFGPYQSGWGLRVIGATAGFDGMCRPSGYQYFVFLDGVFAGTVSPGPMPARATGAGRVNRFEGDRSLTATFVRYADADPLCCPSRPSITVEYRVRVTDRGPVLTPERWFET